MARTSLIAPLTLYVAPTGDDSWAGDAQNPLQHIQYAVNKIANDYDVRDQLATVQLTGGGPAFGNGGVYFNESIELPKYVCGAVRTTHTDPRIQGDPAHPEYHIIYSGAAAGILSICNPLSWTLDGFAIYNNGSFACLEGDNSGVVYYRNLIFGPAKDHVLSIIGSRFVMCGNVHLNSGCSSHLNAEEGGAIVFQPGWNVLLDAGLAFNYFVRAANGGIVEIQSTDTWTGSSTSCPAYADWGGIIQTNGAGLPCTGAPVISRGGAWYN